MATKNFKQIIPYENFEIENNIFNTNCSNILCNNCKKYGHYYYKCTLPIISYGVILFKYGSNGDINFLISQRKNSFGFIDFIKGNYNITNTFHIQNLINEMSNDEKYNIVNKTYEDINKIYYNNKKYNDLSYKKFNSLTHGIGTCNNITLRDIVNNSNTNWNTPEWEFPKGRRNFKERDLDCALREFNEETGIYLHDINIIENILPFEEKFIGSNYKSYKYKYFLAFYNSPLNADLTKFQTNEIGDLKWKSLSQCLESIRTYNLEKKQLINNVYKIIQNYSIYS